MIVVYSYDTNCFRSYPEPYRWQDAKCTAAAPGFQDSKIHRDRHGKYLPRRPSEVLAVAQTIYGPNIKFFYLKPKQGFMVKSIPPGSPMTVNFVDPAHLGDGA